MSPSGQPQQLQPSQLGTKEYWNNLYTTEIINNTADPSDIGTVWFDDSDAEAKIVEFLQERSENYGEGLYKPVTSLLDLGCGNGSLLIALREDEWAGRALGVDYSPQSVALARKIFATTKGESDDEEFPPVEFEEWDVINGPLETVLNGEQADGWDAVLDKGTFDAICLSEETDALGRRLCEGYRDRVLQLVKQGGTFLVTSCNWTEAELKIWFERRDTQGSGFEVVDRIEYPSFSFGGEKGQTISTVCFQKR